MKIKALSIVAPNGSRIASGHKTIEVRTWLPSIDENEDILLVENKKFLFADNDFDLNGVPIAIIKIERVSSFEPEDITEACATVWSKGYYSWHLKDIRPISYTYFVEAKKGIYELNLVESELQYKAKSEPIFDEFFFLQRFHELLKRNELLQIILNRSELLGISCWAVGAGFIQQSIFNLLHGKPVLSDIRDIDWVYFDINDLSEEGEQLVASKVKKLMDDISIPFDVKNQARVHLWYRKKFGYDIKAYQSLEEAVSTWPTTSSAIAIFKKNGELKVIAPFGVSDLINMIVRANMKQITEEIYNKKANRLKSNWPRLKVYSWIDS